MQKLEKLNRSRVLIPLYIMLYLLALLATTLDPLVGLRMLGAMGLVGVLVVARLYYSVVVTHRSAKRPHARTTLIIAAVPFLVAGVYQLTYTAESRLEQLYAAWVPGIILAFIIAIGALVYQSERSDKHTR